MHEVVIKTNYKDLSATIYDLNPKDVKPAILFIPGWLSNQDSLTKYAKSLSNTGYVVLTFDPRGHGKTRGGINLLTRADFLNDSLAAYDYLLQLSSVDPARISVVGASFGGYLGAILTSLRPVEKLVMRAPADYDDEGFYTKYQLDLISSQKAAQWRENAQTNTKALNSLREFKGPALVVESGSDEVISHQVILNYLNANKQLNYLEISDAPHSLSALAKYQEQYKDILLDWFS